MKMVLFSPGSVSSWYTNTSWSENRKSVQVSPSLVLNLGGEDGDRFTPDGKVSACASRSDLLEMSGGAALRDGHQDPAVVPPRVEVGARQRLGKRIQ